MNIFIVFINVLCFTTFCDFFHVLIFCLQRFYIYYNEWSKPQQSDSTRTAAAGFWVVSARVTFLSTEPTTLSASASEPMRFREDVHKSG